MANKVTDPALLALLNAPDEETPAPVSRTPISDQRGKRVTDPALLAELNREQFDAGQMVRNIPGSAWQLAKDVTAPIHSPIQTGKALWKAGTGAAQLAVPGEQGNEPYARAVGAGLKERYGGTDALRRTLQNDPVGLAADVAGLATGGATLAGKAGLKGAATAAKVGRNLDPVVAAQRAVGAVTPKALPRSMMESTMKLRTTLPKADRASIVETMLEQKALPTAGGLRKLQGAQQALGDQIDVLISQAGATGGAIPVEAVTQGLADVRQKLGGPRLTAAKDLAAVDAVEQAFLDHVKQFGPARLTIEDLQKLKTDAYTQINWDRSNQSALRGTEEAYKSVARDARQEIEKQVPEIADVNRRYGNIEKALPEVERAANRIDNRDFMGIGVPIKVGAGAATGGLPGAAAGLAYGLFDSPSVKARAALLAEALRKKGFGKGATPSSSWTTQRALAAQAGRLPEENQE